MMLNGIIAAPQSIDLLVICIRALLSFNFSRAAFIKALDSLKKI